MFGGVALSWSSLPLELLEQPDVRRRAHERGGEREVRFLFRDHRIANGPTLAEFWGAPQDREEEAMASKQRERSIASFNADAPAMERAA